MDYLSSFSPIIRAPADSEDWFQPVINRGRGAAFIDTGFLRGLLDETDQYHTISKLHFDEIKGTSLYTTSFVLLEVTRQISKNKQISRDKSREMLDYAANLMVEDQVILVCVPSRRIIDLSLNRLCELRRTVNKLDLCDVTSITVLEYAQHARVLGYDQHLSYFGAQLEPS